ncbi:MAG TPA: FadR/GntR family transcriptional regulator [Castellaniella sp.]|uniref:FadR/GntR family transcriptional regulator n=1 Tax=Castellaniella sp. TaxID=1955812 RepID=UPI002EEE8510
MLAIPNRRARNLTQSVVDALSDRIRQGEFHAGEKLPTESALMVQFEVSRTVVREAVSHLQAAGLVETRRGIGTFLLEASREQQVRIQTHHVLTVLDVMAILELRISLETEVAGLAAVRRTEAQLQGLRETLDGFAQGLRLSHRYDADAVASDRAFHLQLAMATGNRYFHDILAQLGRSMIPRARVDSATLAEVNRAGYLSRVHLEHEDIFAAVRRRDPDGARAAMRIHLANSRERLRKVQDSPAA